MFIILYFLPYLVYINFIKYLSFCCFYFFLSPPCHSLSFLYSTFSLSFPPIPLGYSKQVVMYHSAVLPMFFFIDDNEAQTCDNSPDSFWVMRYQMWSTVSTFTRNIYISYRYYSLFHAQKSSHKKMVSLP